MTSAAVWRVATPAPAGGSVPVVGLALAAAVVPAVLLTAAVAGEVLALEVLGVSCVAVGIAAFVDHGERRITGAGIYCLAAAIFVGGGCLYYAVTPPSSVGLGAMLTAALVAYGTTVAMYAGWWSSTRRVERSAVPRLAPEVATFGQRTGLLLLVCGLALQAAWGERLGPLPDAAAFDGALLLAVSTILRQRDRTAAVPVRSAVLASSAFAAYVAGAFTGGGRLVLVSLALGIALVAQARLRSSHLKVGLVLATVPVLLVFGVVGRNRNGSGDAVGLEAGGLTSVVNPLATFAELLDGGVDDGGTSLFAANAVVLVPRQVWPDKPVGFGRLVAEELRPDSAAAFPDLTAAALNQGEWYYAAGWGGLVAMVVVTGAALRFTDRRLAGALRAGHRRADLLWLVAAVVVTAGVADLAWTGTYIFVGRGVSRIAILLGVLAVVTLTERGPARGPLGRAG